MTPQAQQPVVDMLGNCEARGGQPLSQPDEVMAPRSAAEAVQERLDRELGGLLGGEARPVVEALTRRQLGVSQRAVSLLPPAGELVPIQRSLHGQDARRGHGQSRTANHPSLSPHNADAMGSPSTTVAGSRRSDRVGDAFLASGRLSGPELLSVAVGSPLIAFGVFGSHLSDGDFYNDDWRYYDHYAFQDTPGFFGAVETFSWTWCRPGRRELAAPNWDGTEQTATYGQAIFIDVTSRRSARIGDRATCVAGSRELSSVG